MKRKIILSALLLALSALLATGGTLAWFTSETPAVNVITSGNIEITLHDSAGELLLDDGGRPQFAPVQDFDPVEGVVPGQEIPKFVSVVNTGDNPAYVRVQIRPVWYQKVNGELVPLTSDELADKEIGGGSVTLAIGQSWTAGADDYYYYGGILEAGQATPTLLSQVALAPQLGNGAKNLTLRIEVLAEATQSANRGAADYQTVWGSLPEPT